MLFILCPLFIQELTSDTGYKIYRIQNKLYPDLDIRLYDTKGNGWENLIQVEKQGVTTIKIPYLKSGKKVYLEIHHKEFGRLYYEELYKKEYTSYASSGAEVKQTNVFIVHGHDEFALYELDNILTKEFHLNAIVLSQMASRGSSTLIDKFEREAKSASYAFVLLTPDDIVEKENGKYIQARPNVLFELGWFCGRLGRDKVCIIKRQGTQIPTDLNGIMYIEYEKKIAEKFGLIQKELKEAKLII
jgi:predicted nucleotide-binding protein